MNSIKKEVHMVTDHQYRRLKKLINTEKTKAIAASKAGMDVKTARKYVGSDIPPSEMKKQHRWRTRKNPFEDVWLDIKQKLNANPGFEAKVLFEFLQRRYPGKFEDSQLRTFQRKVKNWRATEGPGREVFFPQEHIPGEACQSDFTRMNKLDITIQGQPFNHLVYHLVLPYSNWETGTICFSESMESLLEGFQNAMFQLGGVPRYHQTDSLSSAVCNTSNPKTFTARYSALLRHYGLKGKKTNPVSPNENGDIEQRHHRFKCAVEQSLLLRGSRDFLSREDYSDFLMILFNQLNQGRKKRFTEEVAHLRRLPDRRMEACERIGMKVGPSSTIRVKHNVYSVHSRLIGEQIEVRLYADHLDIWYGQKRIYTLPRLRGEEKAHINYRHIIDWLIRKPGAFNHYRYRHALYPTHRFRMAYDILTADQPDMGQKQYLKILYLAAYENESGVDAALDQLLRTRQEITAKAVKALLAIKTEIRIITDVKVSDIALQDYDVLLKGVFQ